METLWLLRVSHIRVIIQLSEPAHLDCLVFGVLGENSIGFAKANSSWLSPSLYRNAFTLPTRKITHSRWKEIHSPWFNGSQASRRKISTHIMEHFSTCSQVVKENQNLSFNGYFSRVVEEYGMGAIEWDIPAVFQKSQSTNFTITSHGDAKLALFHWLQNAHQTTPKSLQKPILRF